jgi:hypothetical protein
VPNLGGGGPPGQKIGPPGNGWTEARLRSVQARRSSDNSEELRTPYRIGLISAFAEWMAARGGISHALINETFLSSYTMLMLNFVSESPREDDGGCRRIGRWGSSLCRNRHPWGESGGNAEIIGGAKGSFHHFALSTTHTKTVQPSASKTGGLRGRITFDPPEFCPSRKDSSL